MTKKDIKAKVKPKAATKSSGKSVKKRTTNKTTTKKKVSAKTANRKKGVNGFKQNIKDRTNRIRKKVNIKMLIFIIFVTAVLLVFSSYAWLSASLNVRVKFFDLVVSTDRGLFISLDGIDFSESVEISLSSIINDLKATYPNHTNQWSSTGLWPVSSNGIKTSNNDKFDIFIGDVIKYKDKNRVERKYLRTRMMTETAPSSSNIYMSFDIFLKNVSGSPKSDNLYFNDDTFIDFAEGTTDDIKEAMRGILNSMRIGIVKVGSVSSKAAVNDIQNMRCNNACEMIIYEPNSVAHSVLSIERAREKNINLIDGEYIPTFGVINEGTYLEHTNGQIGTGIPLDTSHFALQKTIKNFEDPIFAIPNGITKLRTYVWIEGQDIDSLETNSKGALLAIAINFVKDLAGYQ